MSNITPKQFMDDIIKLTQRPDTEKASIVIGTVTKLDPLEITVDKLPITETFLYLSPFVREVWMPIYTTVDGVPTAQFNTHSHTVAQLTTNQALSGEYQHTHTINSFTTNATGLAVLAYTNLVVGDTVHMLRVDDGQKYVVLWKGVVTNDS